MDTHSLFLLGSLVVLLTLSAFFSASETAFSSLNRIKIKNLAAKGDKRAALVLKLAENYDKLLSTVLIGNNIVNITSSVLATVLFVGFFGNAGVSIATLVTTVFVLLVGEISPKTLAKEAPEQFALFSAPFLNFLIVIFAPVNHLLTLWKKGLSKLFKVHGDRGVTEAELLTFVEEVRQEGGINEREEDMIRRTIEFDDLTAHDIFTPRIDVEAVSTEDSLEAIDARFRETDFSRLPIYKETIDNIVGVILLKDFHEALIKKQPVSEIVKPVVFITESIKIAKLLRILQEKKSHLAVLVDEFGGTRGIITIEDIVEELVGEIWDEHDDVVENIVKIDEKTWKIIGNTSIEDVRDIFPLETLPRHTTVANWIVETIGGVPKERDAFTTGSLRVTVSKVKRHRVMEAIVSREQNDG
jgi:CBS domain containing-hemolysin-like protein